MCNRIGTNDVFTASCHTLFPSSFDRSSICHYYFYCLLLNLTLARDVQTLWRHQVKMVARGNVSHDHVSCVMCEGRRRKVKVRWKNLQSTHNYQYHRVIWGSFFISFHRHFKPTFKFSLSSRKLQQFTMSPNTHSTLVLTLLIDELKSFELQHYGSRQHSSEDSQEKATSAANLSGDSCGGCIPNLIFLMQSY